MQIYLKRMLTTLIDNKHHCFTAKTKTIAIKNILLYLKCNIFHSLIFLLHQMKFYSTT